LKFMLAKSTNDIPTCAVVDSVALSPQDRLLPLREVREQTALGKTGIYAGVRNRTFPAPVKVGRSSRWLQSEIQKFIEQCAAARNVC
jgi:prophage regulatory protein